MSPPLALTQDPAPAHPCLKAIFTRLGASLLVAVIMPAAIFYASLQTLGITAALIAAVVWTYGATAWRWTTGRPMSGILLMTLAVLTLRTVFTLSTGNTYVYFLQPVISDVAIAVIFLGSLVTARPVVSRLASDFYPLQEEMAGRASVRLLFRRLTLMWGFVCLLRSAVGFWLLETLSTADFVLVQTITLTTLTVCAVAVTVYVSLKVLRSETLVAPARVALPA